MATEVSKPSLLNELAACGKRNIDTLHITSWDLDHCSESGLRWVLETLLTLCVTEMPIHALSPPGALPRFY